FPSETPGLRRRDRGEGGDGALRLSLGFRAGVRSPRIPTWIVPSFRSGMESSRRQGQQPEVPADCGPRLIATSPVDVRGRSIMDLHVPAPSSSTSVSSDGVYELVDTPPVHPAPAPPELPAPGA